MVHNRKDTDEKSASGNDNEEDARDLMSEDIRDYEKFVACHLENRLNDKGGSKIEKV